MIKEIRDGIIVLKADDGKLIADKDAVYGKQVWLGVGRDESEFYEVEDNESPRIGDFAEYIK